MKSPPTNVYAYFFGQPKGVQGNMDMFLFKCILLIVFLGICFWAFVPRKSVERFDNNTPSPTGTWNLPGAAPNYTPDAGSVESQTVFGKGSGYVPPTSTTPTRTFMDTSNSGIAEYSVPASIYGDISAVVMTPPPFATIPDMPTETTNSTDYTPFVAPEDSVNPMDATPTPAPQAQARIGLSSVDNNLYKDNTLNYQGQYSIPLIPTISTMLYDSNGLVIGSPADYAPTYDNTVNFSKLTGMSYTTPVMESNDRFGGFCTFDKTQPDQLEYKCNKLDADMCASTSCCVLLGGSKCVSGDKSGPVMKANYTDPTVLNRDRYYYMGKCYGNCTNPLGSTALSNKILLSPDTLPSLVNPTTTPPTMPVQTTMPVQDRKSVV